MKLVDWIKRVAGARSVQSSPDSSNIDEDAEVDPYDPFPEPVTIEITDVIDLHTIQPKDVKRVVEEYLEQVHRAGFQTVRIIHGKGIGMQRHIVRTVLAGTSFVDTWTDAPPEAGGLGATIVKLL
jgi:dsDNA-specific endonuclease/ATPase MutS2